MFPPYRLSQLEQDVSFKRQAYFSSQKRLVDRTRATISTKSLLGGGLVGGLVSVAGLFMAGKFILRGGYLSQILKTGLLMGIRTLTPVVKPFVNSLVKKILKKVS